MQPARGTADQISPNGEWLRVVALHRLNGETTVYTAPISSITYVRSTDMQIPWVLSASWEKPDGALGSGLRAILLPDGRVQSANCLLDEWPILAAWKASHNMAEVSV